MLKIRGNSSLMREPCPMIAGLKLFSIIYSLVFRGDSRLAMVVSRSAMVASRAAYDRLWNAIALVRTLRGTAWDGGECGFAWQNAQAFACVRSGRQKNISLADLLKTLMRV
jgi:hypothetical protein